MQTIRNKLFKSNKCFEKCLLRFCWMPHFWLIYSCNRQTAPPHTVKLILLFWHFCEMIFLPISNILNGTISRIWAAISKIRSNCIAPPPNCIGFLSSYSDAVWRWLLYLFLVFCAYKTGGWDFSGFRDSKTHWDILGPDWLFLITLFHMLFKDW